MKLNKADLESFILHEAKKIIEFKGRSPRPTDPGLAGEMARAREKLAEVPVNEPATADVETPIGGLVQTGKKARDWLLQYIYDLGGKDAIRALEALKETAIYQFILGALNDIVGANYDSILDIVIYEVAAGKWPLYEFYQTYDKVLKNSPKYQEIASSADAAGRRAIDGIDRFFQLFVNMKELDSVVKNQAKILKIVNITGPPNDNIVARATVVKYSDKKSPVTIFQRKGVEPKVIGSFAYTGHGVQALENMTSRSPEAVNSGGKFLISLEREVRNATSAGDDALLAAQRRIRNSERPIIRHTVDPRFDSSWIDNLIDALPENEKSAIKFQNDGTISDIKGKSVNYKLASNANGAWASAAAQINNEINKLGALRRSWKPENSGLSVRLSDILNTSLPDRMNIDISTTYDFVHETTNYIWGVDFKVKPDGRGRWLAEATDNIAGAGARGQVFDFFSSRRTGDVWRYRTLLDQLESGRLIFTDVSGAELDVIKEMLAQLGGTSDQKMPLFPRVGIGALLSNGPYDRKKAGVNNTFLSKQVEDLRKLAKKYQTDKVKVKKSALETFTGPRKAKYLRYLPGADVLDMIPATKGMNIDPNLTLEAMFRQMKKSGKTLNVRGAEKKYMKFLDELNANDVFASDAEFKQAKEAAKKIFVQMETISDRKLFLRVTDDLLALTGTLMKGAQRVLKILSPFFYLSDLNELEQGNVIQTPAFRGITAFFMMFDPIGVIGYLCRCPSYLQPGTFSFACEMRKSWLMAQSFDLGPAEPQCYGLSPTKTEDIRIYNRIIQDYKNGKYEENGWHDYESGNYFGPERKMQKDFSQIENNIDIFAENFEKLYQGLAACFERDKYEPREFHEILKRSVEAATKITSITSRTMTKSSIEKFVNSNLSLNLSPDGKPISEYLNKDAIERGKEIGAMGFTNKTWLDVLQEYESSDKTKNVEEFIKAKKPLMHPISAPLALIFYPEAGLVTRALDMLKAKKKSSKHKFYERAYYWEFCHTATKFMAITEGLQRETLKKGFEKVDNGAAILRLTAEEINRLIKYTVYQKTGYWPDKPKELETGAILKYNATLNVSAAASTHLSDKPGAFKRLLPLESLIYELELRKNWSPEKVYKDSYYHDRHIEDLLERTALTPDVYKLWQNMYSPKNVKKREGYEEFKDILITDEDVVSDQAVDNDDISTPSIATSELPKSKKLNKLNFNPENINQAWIHNFKILSGLKSRFSKDDRMRAQRFLAFLKSKRWIR